MERLSMFRGRLAVLAMAAMLSATRTDAQSPPEARFGRPWAVGSTLHVVDAFDLEVGPVTELNTASARVTFGYEHLLFTIAFNTNAALGSPGGLLFESNDCTGRPFMGDVPGNVLSRVFVGGTGVLVEDRGVEAVERPILSILGRDMQCFAGETPQLLRSRPVVELPAFLSSFSPPFRVSTRPGRDPASAR